RELAQFDKGAVLENNQLAVKAKTGSGLVVDPETVALDLAVRANRDEAMKRARRARPAAFGLALTVGAVVGAAVFLSGASMVLVSASRPDLTDTEKLLIGILAGLCWAGATLGALRALASRWRSALAVERLAGGLRGAVTSVLGGAGVLAFAW